jgi:hypothetical protein
MVIDTRALYRLRKLKQFSCFPIIFRSVLFYLVTTSVIYETNFFSLNFYDVCILVKCYLLEYLFESASQWFNSVLLLYFYFYCFLISHVSFYFFDHKQNPWFFSTFEIWIFSFNTFLIKLYCIIKIFAHVFCVIILLIIKYFYYFIFFFTHLKLIIIELNIFFIFFSYIVLAFLNFLAKNSHSASDSIKFNKFWLHFWTVYHVVISQNTHLNWLNFLTDLLVLIIMERLKFCAYIDKLL